MGDDDWVRVQHKLTAEEPETLGRVSDVLTCEFQIHEVFKYSLGSGVTSGVGGVVHTG